MFNNLFKKKVSLCALLSITILFIACNNDSSSEQTNDTTAARQAGNTGIKSMNYFNCLRYDSTEFIAMLKKTPRSQKLILKFFSPNLWETELKFQLLAYPAQNHVHYGRNTVPDTLKILEACSLNTTADSIYVFGNSEIRVKDLHDLVINGKDTISFSYFKFTPVIDTSGLKSRSILYIVHPTDKNGNHINPIKKTLRTLISNPSPPATAL